VAFGFWAEEKEKPVHYVAAKWSFTLEKEGPYRRCSGKKKKGRYTCDGREKGQSELPPGEGGGVSYRGGNVFCKKKGGGESHYPIGKRGGR